MKPLRVVSVVGARPNFVKMAPLLRVMRSRPEVEAILVHTGQHYDGPMSDRFFSDLDIQPPAFNLGVGSGSHAVQTAEVMRRIEPVLEQTRPDLLLVVGDVNSTLAAALVAVKLGVPVAHVEAGLRSFDTTMPEEINRRLTDALAELLFVTEPSGVENLKREGTDPSRIHLVGNVMIDALEHSRPLWSASDVLRRLGLDDGRRYGVLTLHRPANVDDPGTLALLLGAVQQVARELPIVFPVHPRVRRPQGMAEDAGPDKGIHYMEPLGYLEFVALLSRASLVLTDSGGIQEETTVLGVPCLTLRPNTERPITVTHGTNRIVGTDPRHIVDEALSSLDRPATAPAIPPLWDGHASERIVRILLEGRAGRPA